MLIAEDVRDLLEYDPATGLLRWRKKTCRKVVVGAVAGNQIRAGYIVVGIAGRIYYAHRLAWLWMTGEWPERVDHADGNKANNAWANLRTATPQQNGLNARRAVSNTSGFKGVYWHRLAGKWGACITVMDRQKHLGLFDTPECAHAAYMAAAQSIDPEFARAK